ncbi:hypothetical protein IJJ39_02715 [Candidatus Saccharibacteria bacterium]|nr:hypothetical protein [Candidatus Saccharibacteria bacterium]
MSLAKECPFVLSFDAIANLSAVLGHLKTRNYRAAPGSGHDQFRPELHLPVQLIAHTCTHARTDVADGHRKSVNDIRELIDKHLHERYSNSDGDITFGLKDPFASIVFDSDHGIRRDPSRYGEELVPTQLVIDHACRLRDLLAKRRISSTTNAQQTAHGKLNITIVTHYPATIAIALAEGFQVWNYDARAVSEIYGLSVYDKLLIKQGLVEITRHGQYTVPTEYHKRDGEGSAKTPIDTQSIV